MSDNLDKLWFEDIMGGCVEVLWRLGKDLYIENECIGTIEDYAFPKDGKVAEDVVSVGDYKYGCCDDIIIRKTDVGYALLLPLEDYFAAHLGAKFKWEKGYKVTLIDGWQEIAMAVLREHNAEFVMEELCE